MRTKILFLLSAVLLGPLVVWITRPLQPSIYVIKGGPIDAVLRNRIVVTYTEWRSKGSIEDDSLALRIHGKEMDIITVTNGGRSPQEVSFMTPSGNTRIILPAYGNIPLAYPGKEEKWTIRVVEDDVMVGMFSLRNGLIFLATPGPYVEEAKPSRFFATKELTIQLFNDTRLTRKVWVITPEGRKDISFKPHETQPLPYPGNQAWAFEADANDSDAEPEGIGR